MTMKSPTTKPITSDILDHEDGHFYDLTADSRAVSFHYDYDGDDIRYGWVPIVTFLDVCCDEGAIIHYDLRDGTVTEFLPFDDYRDHKTGDWLDWFLEEGPRQVVQSLIRKAAKIEQDRIDAEVERRLRHRFHAVTVYESEKA